MCGLILTVVSVSVPQVGFLGLIRTVQASVLAGLRGYEVTTTLFGFHYG